MADVKVFVWLPKYNSSILSVLEDTVVRYKSGAKDAGHAAIAIGDTYVTVHRDRSGYWEDKICIPYSDPEEEIQASKKKPIKFDPISWLNTDEMLKAWDRMKEDPYNLGYSCCSGICKQLLIKGALLSDISRKNFPKSFQYFMKYMTYSDPTVSSLERNIKLQFSYPKTDFYRNLAQEFYDNNKDKKLKAIGIQLRNLPLSSPGLDTFSTPIDIIHIAEILTSDFVDNYR